MRLGVIRETHSDRAAAVALPDISADSTSQRTYLHAF